MNWEDKFKRKINHKPNPVYWECDCDNSFDTWRLTQKTIYYKRKKGTYKNFLYVCGECGRPKSQSLKYDFVDYILRKKNLTESDIPQTGEILLSSNKSLYDEKVEELKNQFIFLKKEYWWKGYQEYLESDEWKKKRDSRLSLDNWRCQDCGKYFKKYNSPLMVHHKSYQGITVITDFQTWAMTGKFEMEFNEDIYYDLISLCYACHKKAHYLKDRELSRSNFC